MKQVCKTAGIKDACIHKYVGLYSSWSNTLDREMCHIYYSTLAASPSAWFKGVFLPTVTKLTLRVLRLWEQQTQGNMQSPQKGRWRSHTAPPCCEATVLTTTPTWRYVYIYNLIGSGLCVTCTNTKLKLTFTWSRVGQRKAHGYLMCWNQAAAIHSY